jgi:hypothetical protein
MVTAAPRQRVVVTRFGDLIHPPGADAGSLQAPAFTDAGCSRWSTPWRVVKQGSTCVGLHSATHAVHTASASQPQQADHGEFPLVTFLISLIRRSIHATLLTPDRRLILQADVEVDPEMAVGAQPKKRTFLKFSYRGVLDVLLDMSMDDLV